MNFERQYLQEVSNIHTGAIERQFMAREAKKTMKSILSAFRLAGSAVKLSDSVSIDFSRILYEQMFHVVEGELGRICRHTHAVVLGEKKGLFIDAVPVDSGKNKSWRIYLRRSDLFGTGNDFYPPVEKGNSARELAAKNHGISRGVWDKATDVALVFDEGIKASGYEAMVYMWEFGGAFADHNSDDTPVIYMIKDKQSLAAVLPDFANMSDPRTNREIVYDHVQAGNMKGIPL